MNAYDDECGCGEYSCRRCFSGDASLKGNAWFDQGICSNLAPDTIAYKLAAARLGRVGMKVAVPTQKEEEQ